MPYIKEEHRDGWARTTPHNPGELNFAITKLLDEYIDWRGLSYSTLNEVIGVLECAKLELYRRIAAPYEDQKIQENGDVYTVAPPQWEGSTMPCESCGAPAGVMCPEPNPECQAVCGCPTCQEADANHQTQEKS